MTIEKILDLAKKHSNKGIMSSSAVVSLMDAKHLYERGLIDYAKKRALDSLKYSVGIFHQDYIKASQ
jgi:hypothetical protein